MTSVDNVECIFVSVRISSQPLLIGGVYIPPQSPSLLYSSYCDAVEEVYASCQPDTKVILVGDLNQPEVEWSLPRCVPINAASEHLLNMAHFIQATQVNSVFNSRGVLLDLVFSSVSSVLVRAASDPLLPQEAYHPALEFSVPFECSKSSDRNIYVRNLRKCNVDEVRHWIESLNYPILNEENVLDVFSQFCRDLGDCVCQNSPLVRKTRSYFPSWFSSDLRALVINKKVLHRKYKMSLSHVDYCAFRAVRSQCKALTEICYSNYMRKIDVDVKENPKSFWGYIKSLCKVNTSPSKLIHDQVSVDEPSQMCELFADYFATVYAPPSSCNNDYLYESNVNASSLNISAVEVERKLRCLDGSKGAGPDNITPLVLKSCSSVIAPHLTLYFNQLLGMGCFPDVLKHGYLVPVHKSGDISVVGNYRPIVLQSVIAKVFEALILDFLSFKFKNVFITEQHGFRPGRSTVTNLCLFTNYIYSAFSRHHQVDCIYLDFAKAFDRVSHSHLVVKLRALGFSGPLLRWIQSYLSGRTLQVKFASFLSSSVVRVTSGVPQGSLLGPFLFSLFINDIGSLLDCKFVLFADDIKIYQEVSSVCHQLLLQKNLDNVAQWCEVNAMHLNVSKCQVMTFGRSRLLIPFVYSLRGSMLKRVTVVKDLGVFFTPNLDPGEHILKICAKANRVLGLIARVSRNAFSPETLKCLYVTLVRPILEYGSPIWAPHQIGHCCSLNHVEKRFLRLMGVRDGQNYLDVDVREVADHYGLVSLTSRRIALDLFFLFKIVNGLVDCPELLQLIDIHVPHRTRLTQTFAKHHYSTAYEYHSTVPRLMRLGNDSQLEIFGQSFALFRRLALTYVSDLAAT